MTTKKTWTEEEYEAAGKKSIHLRLIEDAYDALSWLSYKLDEGRAQLVARLVFEEEERVKARKA
jgi:hypothetical protein